MSTAVTRYFQSIHGLGPIVRVFESSTSRRARLLLLVTTLICGLGAVGLAVYALMTGYQQYYAHGPALVWHTVRVPALAALLLLAAALAAGWRSYSAHSRCAAIYANGFAYHGPSGVYAFRWQDIISLTAIHQVANSKSSGGSGRHILSLTGSRGERVTLGPGLARADEFIEAVRASVFPILYERMARQYDSGQALNFGPIAITRAGGMTLRGRTIPWQDFTGAALENGMLVLPLKDKKEPGPIRVPAHQLMNIDVLLTILDLTIGMRARVQPAAA